MKIDCTHPTCKNLARKFFRSKGFVDMTIELHFNAFCQDHSIFQSAWDNEISENEYIIQSVLKT